MALYATQNIGDAFDITREFLLPFDLRRWVKLAIVAFFIGGGMSFPTSQFNMSETPEQLPETGAPFTVPEDILPIVATIIVVAVLLAVLFGVIGSIMEFVFIESLRTGNVSIRKYWDKRWRQGLRLFGFRIAITLPVLVIFLGWMALFLVPLATGGSGLLVPFAVFLLGIPFLFGVGLVYGLVTAFTTVFVVPIMIKEESSVLAGWRRLWPSVKANWKQYLAYAGIGFVLTVAAGLLASVVLGISAVVLLIPFGVLAGIAQVTVSLSSSIGLAVLAVLGLLFIVAMAGLWALVQVPILTYLRYYALLVLGDIDASFDIIADQRDIVRE